MACIDFAWELGGNTGHFSTLLPIARAMRSRGHAVRFFLHEPAVGLDLEGADGLSREGAPFWDAPPNYPDPLNFGEILLNFGYHDAGVLKQLIDAWRERLWLSDALIANVAPTAHLAALTLGIPSFEISQGFHIPPAMFPAPPLRDWLPSPRASLEAADTRVLQSINAALAAYGVAPLKSIGDIFAGRSMLLTYPELDIYPGRGPAEYFGIPDSGEGSARPPWPAGDKRVFMYLYHHYSGLDALAKALHRLDVSTLAFCRGLPADFLEKHNHGNVHFCAEAMAASALLPQADLVICHASHQMTAQALLAGKPLLMLPTQLEQYLIMRRVVRHGSGLGIAPDTPQADFGAALTELLANPGYGEKARAFATRYTAHDRNAALATMIARCETAIRPARLAAR